MTSPASPDPHDLIPETQRSAAETARADARVGTAVRWSIGFLLAIAAIGGGAWWLTRPTPTETPTAPAPAGPSPVRPPPEGALVQIPYRDVTAPSGILFERENGARGEKLLPETMGGGIAIADFDGDGDQDLLFVNGMPWPWDAPPTGTHTPRLFANSRAGDFIEVTNHSGIDVPIQGMGVAVGDYDGDGKPDVFLSAVGRDRLFRNITDRPSLLRFEEVTDQVGLPDESKWGTSAGFLDYDRDGDLDLFVCQYVEWSPEIDRKVGYQLTGLGRAYGPPDGFAGMDCILYRNDDGHFTDVTEPAGIHVANKATGRASGKALGTTFVDVDRDGWIDILVADDKVPKCFFRNKGDGTFEEIGAGSGFAFDRNGNATGAMGIDAAWYRDDERLGVAVGNFANEMSSLYAAEKGSTRMTDDAIPEGIGPATRRVLTFGTLFVDADLDGWEDLVQANGHLEDEINTVYRSQQYRQSGQLFRNIVGFAADGPAFVELVRSNIGDLAQPFVGRGAAYGDLDGDGDLDLVLVQPKGAPLVLRNEQSIANRFVRFKLVGQGKNREAIGAEIELMADGRLRRARVMPTRSYLSQVELPVTFGLGKAHAVDTVRIRWPDGTEQIVDGETLVIDSLNVIEQPAKAASAPPAGR